MANLDRPILITGGAGFIGSTLVRTCLQETSPEILNLDKLTYAGHRKALEEVLDEPRHTLVVGDIADQQLVSQVLNEHDPLTVIHLAAETHVDRSIASPVTFANTNVHGFCAFLQTVTNYWRKLPAIKREEFVFLNVSTDEVFGTAAPGQRFTEQSPLAPNSPYSASKAAGEMLARAFQNTYGLPVITANPSNNYGPRQHPEKFIPRMILAALQREPLPVYGDGLYERDWLHVEDCSRALLAILKDGTPGQRFLVGANSCLPNLEVVHLICELVDEYLGDGFQRKQLITHVPDRPGHDRRYAVDASYLHSQTGWQSQIDFAAGLRTTVRWYMENLYPVWQRQ